MAQTWFLIIENLPDLIQIFNKGIGDHKLTLLISKILFYADRIPEAVTWAMKSQLDITERSLYMNTILSSIVQQYREIIHKPETILENSIEKSQLEKVIEILI